MFNRIAIDMDDVLVAWDQAVCKLFNVDYEKTMSKRENKWDINYALGTRQHELEEKIFNEGSSWWAEIEPLPWCKELITLCRSITPNVFILTSPMNHLSCHIGKLQWIAKHFTPAFIDIRIENKKELYNDGHTLIIDDKYDNCMKFPNQNILFPHAANPKREIRFGMDKGHWGWYLEALSKELSDAKKARQT